MSWENYLHQIQNKPDPETAGGWGQLNICQYACIYGHDGTPWVASPGYQLSVYKTPLADESGKETMVECNEHAALMKATEGNRKP